MSQTHPRVFVTHDMGFDYSDAEKSFGELVILLHRDEVDTEAMGRVYRLLKKRLWDYEFGSQDFILAQGAPAVIMAVGALAAAYTPELNVLQWDRKREHYRHVRVPLR